MNENRPGTGVLVAPFTPPPPPTARILESISKRRNDSMVRKAARAGDGGAVVGGAARAAPCSLLLSHAMGLHADLFWLLSLILGWKAR